MSTHWISRGVLFDDPAQAGAPAGYVRRAAEIPVGPGRNFVRIEGNEN